MTQLGLHTGECDVSAGRYSGYAVTLAQRIADKAEVGCTLVSRTVKDLVAGSGIMFIERGELSFGEIGRCQLFSVGGC